MKQLSRVDAKVLEARKSSHRVLFVGDIPSSLNKDPKIAFVGARCHSVLITWQMLLGVDGSRAVNSGDLDKLRSDLVMYHWLGYKIVALGNEAQKRIARVIKSEDLKIPYYKIDHPSGLNRKLNNQKYVDNMLEACYNWINHE